MLYVVVRSIIWQGWVNTIQESRKLLNACKTEWQQHEKDDGYLRG